MKVIVTANEKVSEPETCAADRKENPILTVQPDALAEAGRKTQIAVLEEELMALSATWQKTRKKYSGPSPAEHTVPFSIVLLLSFLSTILLLISITSPDLEQALSILWEVDWLTNLLRLLLLSGWFSLFIHSFFNQSSIGFQVDKQAYLDEARKLQQAINRLQQLADATVERSPEPTLGKVENLPNPLPSGRSRWQWGRSPFGNRRRWF